MLEEGSKSSLALRTHVVYACPQIGDVPRQQGICARLQCPSRRPGRLVQEAARACCSSRWPATVFKLSSRDWGLAYFASGAMILAMAAASPASLVTRKNDGATPGLLGVSVDNATRPSPSFLLICSGRVNALGSLKSW